MGSTGSLRGLAERHERWLAAVVVLAACAFAWSQRFAMDDAYISFRYARNLVSGHGLVWNLGERVEGYTNFLWTLWLALPHALGVDPWRFCAAHIPVFVCTSLLAVRALARAAGADAVGRLLAMVVLGAQPSFAAFASGGLETGAVTALGVLLLASAAGAFARGGLGPGLALAIGTGTSALFMLRLDALWIAAGVGLLSLAAALSGGAARRPRAGAGVISVALLAAPLVLILAAWFIWRHAYYGAWLPNTFQAKAVGAQWARGATYLGVFARSTWILPALALIAAALPAALRAALPAPGAGRADDSTAARADEGAGSGDAATSRVVAIFSVVLLCVACHTIWVVYAGGDFMEFRFLVPVLPLVAALFAAALGILRVAAPLALALGAAVLAGWLHHARTFSYTAGIESVPALAAHLDAPGQDWRGIGRALRVAFGDAPEVRIAVSPAGVIPYESQLPAVDMLGLNDREVAMRGIPVASQPGHARVASTAYLVRREVHLVIGHPWLLGPDAPPGREPEQRGLAGFGYLVDATPKSVPASATLLEIPLSGRRRLIALYLTPHLAIERAAARGGWKRRPLPWRGGAR